MTYEKLLQRLRFWEKTLRLVEQLKKDHIYKLFDSEKDYYIGIPCRYSLTSVSFRSIASSYMDPTRSSFPLVSKKWAWTFSTMIQKFKVIEEVRKEELPLYLHDPFVNSGLIEKILKGEKKIRS